MPRCCRWTRKTIYSLSWEVFVWLHSYIHGIADISAFFREEISSIGNTYLFKEIPVKNRIRGDISLAFFGDNLVHDVITMDGERFISLYARLPKNWLFNWSFISMDIYFLHLGLMWGFPSRDHPNMTWYRYSFFVVLFATVPCALFRTITTKTVFLFYSTHMKVYGVKHNWIILFLVTLHC